MKLTDRRKKQRRESNILETPADKIIFWSALGVYTVVMLIEIQLTPHSNVISSSIAAFSIAAFLVSKMIHIYRTRPPVTAKEKVKFWAMPAVSLLLVVSGAYWLLKKFVL